MLTSKLCRLCAIVVASLCLVTVLSGCGGKQTETPNSGFAQVVNPLVTVDSPQEMEDRLGYPVPLLDKEVSSYIVLVIDGTADSGRIRYADGSDFNIKQGSGDISGIHGGTPDGTKTVAGISVSFFVYENSRYAIWEKDGFTFSLTGGTSLEEDITALIEAP